MRAATISIFVLLLVGCAHARPRVKTTAPVTIVEKKPAPPPEKVAESELLDYKAAFLRFKALEMAIIEKYHIHPDSDERFDPDSGLITRKK